LSVRHLLIMNPAAGRRHGRDPQAVLAAFRRRGLDADLAVTERPGHARDIVEAQGAGFEVIVVVGGDGTLYETIQTLDLDRHRLGLIPWGSGNDFAWSAGISGDLDACVERIASGLERRLDLGLYEVDHSGGRMTGRFHNQMGFGFEALVNAESHQVKRVRGAAVYVWALFRALPRYRSYPVTIDWPEGHHEAEVLLLAVGNGRRVGGCFRFFPLAAQEDGKLDLLHTGRIGFLRAPAVLSRLIRGTHVGARGIHYTQAPTFTVRSATGIPVYVDGEFLTREATTVRVETLPRCLRIV